MRLKSTIYESTLSTAARSPFPNGEGCETRMPLSPKHSLSRVGKCVSSRRYTRAPYPPLRGPPSPMGKAAIRGCRFSRHNAFPKGEGKEEAASPPKKKANPASLRSAAPSKGRGSRGHSLLPVEGGAPKGRIRIKCSAVLCKSIYESSIIKQMIWTGWGLVTSSGVTPLQNR